MVAPRQPVPSRAEARGGARAGKPPRVSPHHEGLQLFLKNIGKVRLLTAQKDVDLAKRIKRGDLDAKQKMIKSTSASAPVSLGEEARR